MKQIKTIQAPNAAKFDELVNEALAEGWELTRRECSREQFVAFLEREEETEEDPVTVAQWVPTRDPFHPWRCAACGLKATNPYDECPSCGAIMEVEV